MKVELRRGGNHGEHGDHGEKRGKGFMEERFSMAYNQAYPRDPRGSFCSTPDWN
jgi:hypothetical protein